MHPLEFYLQEKKITQKEFAKQIKTSEATVSNILTGKFKPRLDTAIKIQIITEGKITFEKLLYGI